MPVPDREPRTVRELTVLAAEALGALGTANARILAVDEILADAERCAAEGRAGCGG